MADVFWAYWDASVRFGLLALMLLIATPLLKRWLSPKLICWAWAILILRLSLPLALPFSGSIFNLSEQLQPSTWTDALRSGVVDVGWGETIIPKFRDEDELVKATLVGFSWEDVLLVIWIAGIAVLGTNLVVNAVRLHRFFGRAERRNSDRLYEIFKDTRRRYGIHSNVPLLISDDVKTPGIAGIFNPRIVLPRVCAEELSESELRCVFLHELTHFRRGDLFLHHFLLLICFVHWFNPLVWLVFREFKISMEQACDADVVDSECIETVQEYGLTLLQVMRRSRVAHASPAGALCLLGNRKSNALKNRIRLIAQPRRCNPLFVVLGLSVFGVSFVFALTGETAVDDDAERLFKLTRFSGQALFMAQTSLEREVDKQSPWYDLADPESISSPPSWVQDIDVSEHKGQEIVVRIQYRSDEANDLVDFWLHVKNARGQIIATARKPDETKAKWREGLRVLEIAINLSESAEEIAYGMTSAGPTGVRVESLDFVPLAGSKKSR